MLRTNNKSVIEKLRIHVLENFAETAEYERDHDNPEATPLTCLVSQIDYMRYGGRSVYATALDWVEGGSALVYYREQRDFLGDLLEATEFEREHKYSDDQVFKTYCHLVARTMAQLYAEGK